MARFPVIPAKVNNRFAPVPQHWTIRHPAFPERRRPIPDNVCVRSRKRFPAWLISAVVVLCTLGACAAEDATELRQIAPGTVVYVDAWDEDGDRGDQAQIERKPSGLWVVPLQAHFRTRKADGFDVRVELARDGRWLVDPEGTRVGRDHDDCLEDGEAYAQMVPAESALVWEPDTGSGTDNDDCYTLEPEAN